jgi:hypothetical protein
LVRQSLFISLGELPQRKSKRKRCSLRKRKSERLQRQKRYSRRVSGREESKSESDTAKAEAVQSQEKEEMTAKAEATVTEVAERGIASSREEARAMHLK